MHPAIDEPNELAIWMFILTTAGWMIKTWWTNKLNKHDHKKVEKKLEKDWSNGDDTISGRSNPGRSLAQLIEIVHDDLKIHKQETGRKFDRLINDVGKIKGKLDID